MNSANDVELLRRVYALFNSRDIERRSYWQRLWAIVDPHVEPVGISPHGEGQVILKVHQVVRDLNGNV